MSRIRMDVAKALADAREQTFQIYESGNYPKAEIARHYITTHSPRYLHDISEVAERLEPGDHILDLGAAPFCTSQTYHNLGFDVTAADFRPTDWLEPDRLPYNVVETDCDGKALPFEDQSFSAVVFTEIFEHLHVNLNFTMKEILRVLKPNGFLYLTTPNLNGVRNMWRLIWRGTLTGEVYDTWKGAETEGFLGHVREYTAGEIAVYLPQCGFREVEVTTENVYYKQWFETNFWKALTWPFPNGRETIVAVARRAA